MNAPRQPDAERARLKTYGHLLAQHRQPSDYDLATTALLYYVTRGFEVQVPAQAWYDRYQSGSPLTCSDWERFADPRSTTYTSYTALQKRQETFVDGLLAAMAEPAYVAALSPDWLDVLEQVLPPFRYAAHGLQMIAAYVGHMAPSGKIVVAAAFQVADEIRRIERIAYRMRQLQEVRPGFGDASRQIWEDAPAWQPLREVIERLLVTYDWGEAFVGLNLCLKPAIDGVLVSALAPAARQAGDPLLETLLRALQDDGRWHQAWSGALVATAIADCPANRAVLQTWIDHWAPLSLRAAQSLSTLTGGADESPHFGDFLAPFDLMSSMGRSGT
jgi:toluene monooxygenase system protein E